MSKGVFAAACVVIVLCGVFAAVLLTRDPPVNPPAGDPKSPDRKTNTDTAGAKTNSQPKPLFEGWESPAAVLVLTGEMHGYVEPCGCSANQLGGLSRRADLFRQIKEKGWSVTGLDAGGLVNNPTRTQAKSKFEMALKSLKVMDYQAVALGVEELKLGAELLRFIPPEFPPFFGSNIEFFGVPPDGGSHLSHKIIPVGDLKIGVTAVFGDALKPDVAREQDVKVLDPIESLRKTLALLEAEKPDALVLLAHSSFDESKTYAKEFPRFKLIVATSGPEDPNPKPEMIGETMFIGPGAKGKHVSVVGFEKGDSGLKLRYEVVDLDEKRFQDTRAVQDAMRDYQDLLKVQDLAAKENPIDDPRNVGLEVPNDYVGSKVCGECHTKAYAKWLDTPHSKATESLVKGRKGWEDKWINRIYDPECLSCHVTGWEPQKFFRFKSGYLDEQKSVHLTGQGCENCHGPGGRHVELERQFEKDKKLTDDVLQFREFHQVTLDVAKNRLCVQCHDGDNDPKFSPSNNFDEYWEKVKHPGRK